MGTFTILLGGELIRTPRLERQIAGSRVIAADAGIGHARMLGLVPELWVGDFDSVPANLPEDLASVPRKIFPAEKDMTDGELAIAEALQRGKRADHASLHLALAVRLAEAGTTVLLTSGAQEGVPILPGKASFDYADSTLFSVLGFSDLFGLTVTGAKWPLDRVEVAFGSSLTISNEVKGQLGIALERGRALLLAHPYPLPES
ncbi:MAG: thiamine diphosphokinase [Mesorhizobium sp.]|nr:MAG: thiamine diphosphokinase [Mesorhizobium sp.]